MMLAFMIHYRSMFSPLYDYSTYAMETVSVKIVGNMYLTVSDISLYNCHSLQDIYQQNNSFAAEVLYFRLFLS